MHYAIYIVLIHIRALRVNFYTLSSIIISSSHGWPTWHNFSFFPGIWTHFSHSHSSQSPNHCTWLRSLVCVYFSPENYSEKDALQKRMNWINYVMSKFVYTTKIFSRFSNQAILIYLLYNQFLLLWIGYKLEIDEEFPDRWNNAWYVSLITLKKELILTDMNVSGTTHHIISNKTNYMIICF